MRKALIASRESVTLITNDVGMRIAEIQDTEFDVHNSLFWVDCGDDIEARSHGYKDGQFIELLQPPLIIQEEQPISEGTQEI